MALAKDYSINTDVKITQVEVSETSNEVNPNQTVLNFN